MPSFSQINKNVALSVAEKVKARQQELVRLTGLKESVLTDLFEVPKEVDGIATRNCENLLGQVPIPVGVVGPLKVTIQRVGTDTEQETKENILVPLATTEGALIASVSRGCKALVEAGGAQVITEYVGMSRAPVFAAESGAQARQLVDWFKQHQKLVAEWAAQTSNHLQLTDIQGWVRGRYAFIRFVCDTDQAMGMNMVSIAVQFVWAQLQQKIEQGEEPELTGVTMVSLSSNVCSDKKAGTINGILGRGHWVQAEVTLSKDIVERVLKTSIEALVQTHRAKNELGSALAGSTAQNMQVANVVAAVFAATGQDLAHVVDASQAVTSIEPVGADHVFISVTIPSLPVGVVGGGTWLPVQKQARQLLGWGEQLQAWQLASVIGATVLAGEISGMAALSSNDLACAHQALGRST